MRPIQCIVKTDIRNKIGEGCYTTYGPEIRVNNVLYVDDIVGVGSPMVIENTVKHLTLFEERKKSTFSNTKNVIVNIGYKDRGYQEPKAQVSKGLICILNT